MSGKSKSRSQLLDKKITPKKKSDKRVKTNTKEAKKKNEIYKQGIEFCSLFKGLPYIILFFDKNGTYLKIAKATQLQLLLFGYPTELAGKALHDVFPKQQADYFVDNIKKTIKTKHPVNIEYKLLIDGTEHWFSSTISRVDKNSAISFIHDITKRKYAEEADKKSLQLFRLVWENSIDGMRLTNKEGKILMVNKAFCQLVNKQRSELEDKPLTVAYGKEFKNRASLIHKERFENIGINSFYEYEVTLWNNKIIWFGVSGSYFEIENQEPYLLSIFNNITERKLNEVKINQAFSLLNATLESSADGILVVDLQREITGLNQKFIKMWDIPSTLASSKSESKLLGFLKNKLKKPDAFIARINWLYEFPEAESIDTLEFILSASGKNI
jgi:PAS domain S-box-containing protein